MIRLKRVYDEATKEDGTRFLVERLWPRGIKKTDLHLDSWLKDVAPSDGLRRWFNHDPARWGEFCCRYYGELNSRPDAWKPILEAAAHNAVTLVFSSRDQEHNNAVVLKKYLEEKRHQEPSNKSAA